MMSTADTKPSRKQKQKESKSHAAPNGTERLKAVVRRLPPNLPEEIFWQSVQAWVSNDTVTWKSYYPGKLRTNRVNKESVPSRAYIAFKNEEHVAAFSREYDGHLFRDKAGNESHAVVEFAPFQKLPTEKKKADARNNTIDKDEDYLSFLETLKNTEKAESVPLETLIAASQPPPLPTTTPLLEALKAEKLAQKDKETILRSHAHYKDLVASGTPSKKEEAKKKAAAQAAKQPELPPPLSKKAKKAAATAAAAAQKTSLTQTQHGQSPTGKNPSTGARVGAAPSTTKLPTSVLTTGHAPRHRPPKEPHGRAPSGKGGVSAPVATSVSTSGPRPGPTPTPPVTTENVTPGTPGPAPAQGQGQRKSRPVIGLGRQFEAALNGAGVAVAPGPSNDRKKRDKGGESGPGSGGTVTEGGGGRGGKHRRREDYTPDNIPAAVVPSILQRPEVGEGGNASPDVVIMQRPPSPRAIEGPGGHGGSVGAGSTDAGPGTGAVRGVTRRGRGRGRGGHRGG